MCKWNKVWWKQLTLLFYGVGRVFGRHWSKDPWLRPAMEKCTSAPSQRKSCFPIKRIFVRKTWFSLIQFYMYSSEQSFRFLNIVKYTYEFSKSFTGMDCQRGTSSHNNAWSLNSSTAIQKKTKDFILIKFGRLMMQPIFFPIREEIIPKTLAVYHSFHLLQIL